MDIKAIKEFMNKLKSDKKAIAIIAIGLSGMLLVTLSDTQNKSDSETLQTNSKIQQYTEEELAVNLEKFISSINGAGKTKVMVTYECYEETVYVYDKNEETRSNGETDYSSEHIIIDNGETEDGLKAKILAPEIRGVAVICEGGDSPITKEMIIMSISALLNISSNKISVAPMAN